MTSQSRSFCAFFIMLKMACFYVDFSSVSIERGLGQILYFSDVYTNYEYTICESIYLVQDFALY